ncbi:MAG: CRTAC1 family protein, partial [Planctomycetaceae bacterium]|nr:CRTAC1 family protein [Planctomycetaceae bacterium]
VFADVTETSGLSSVATYGFAGVTADLTGDGWPDMYIANDSLPNVFWVNNKDGTFSDQARERGVAVNGEGAAEGAMGAAIGDVDSNGTVDLVVTNLSTESSTLYLNDGDGYFHDGTFPSGLARPTFSHTGWGVGLVDLNTDGALDIPIANGLVIPCHSGFAPHGEDRQQVRVSRVGDPDSYWRDYADQNQLFLADGPLMRDGTSDYGGDFTRTEGSWRSLIFADCDEDGDMDFVATRLGKSARFFRNDFPGAGHWINIKAFDPARRRDSLGAEVIVDTDQRQLRGLLVPASGFLSHNDARLHVGLGSDLVILQITVLWPDGPVEQCAEVFDNVTVDQSVILKRGAGRPGVTGND